MGWCCAASVGDASVGGAVGVLVLCGAVVLWWCGVVLVCGARVVLSMPRPSSIIHISLWCRARQLLGVFVTSI